MPSPDESRHFTLDPIAEGVWAAIHRIGGWAVGNAGIVDLGDVTLLFDAFLTPDAAEDLAAVALALTGRTPDVIVLSHYHNDHIRGTQVFPGVPLFATRATRGLIDTLGREELASDLEHAAPQLARTAALADAEDPAHRSFAAYFEPYWAGLVASAPHITLRLPNVTFEDRLEIHGSRRTARVISLGAAHTPDDAVLVLEDDGVVFCSDLLFVGSHPYLADGEPDGWLRALDAIGAFGATRFVPGHGPVGTAADVRALADHIRGLQATAAQLHRDGTSDEAVEGLLPTDASAAWDFAYPFYRSNLRFLLARARAGGALG
jgi:cyclase